MNNDFIVCRDGEVIRMSPSEYSVSHIYMGEYSYSIASSKWFQAIKSSKDDCLIDVQIDPESIPKEYRVKVLLMA